MKQWARVALLPARQVERAKIVLLAAAGGQDLEIAAGSAITARRRRAGASGFLRLGLAGLKKTRPDRDASPAIAATQGEEVVRKTTQENPAGATQWSTRSMARRSV